VSGSNITPALEEKTTETVAAQSTTSAEAAGKVLLS
jgi:hypothetical protein